MESNSTAFLIKIKLRHSLGRPSRSDFVQSVFIEPQASCYISVARGVLVCHRLEAEEKKWQNTVKELRSEIALLTRKLECEQEWMPYEDVSGQFYENIANNGVSPASDEETVRFVSTHFGFDMTKISIKRVKPLYEINRHQQLRQAGVTVRNPYIFASDWNYIYFSSMGIDYEILNGKIIPL